MTINEAKQESLEWVGGKVFIDFENHLVRLKTNNSWIQPFVGWIIFLVGVFLFIISGFGFMGIAVLVMCTTVGGILILAKFGTTLIHRNGRCPDRS